MAEDKTVTQADIDKAVKDAVAAAEEALKGKNSELLDEVKKLKADLRKVKEVSPEDVAAIEAERDKALADLATATKAAKEATTAAEKEWRTPSRALQPTSTKPPISSAASWSASFPSSTINGGVERAAKGDTVRSAFTRAQTVNTTFAPGDDDPRGHRSDGRQQDGRAQQLRLGADSVDR
jgi:hypothetical protein